MEVKLPIYTEDRTVKNKRKKNYILELKKSYPNLKKLTEDEYYFEIKYALEVNKDKTVLDKLMEKSLYYILEAVAENYAKYDIEQVLPLEDGMVTAVYEFNKKLSKFDSLPTYIAEYTHSVIHYYVYLILAREYNKEHSKTKLNDLMEPSKLAYEIDKEQFDVIDKTKIDKDSFYEILNSVTSKLTAKEKEFLILYFGLKTGKEMTCQEIANIHNLTRGRVSEAICKALRKIRANKKTKKLKDYYTLDMDV